MCRRNKKIAFWSTSANEKPYHVWPDGCRDLIVYAVPGQVPKVRLSGLDHCAYPVKMPVGTHFWGIRLSPGVMVRDGQANPFSKAWLKRITSNPQDAPTLLQDAVEDWFSDPESITWEFFDAIKHSYEKIPRLSQSDRTLRRRIRTATGAPPRFWLSLLRIRSCARQIVFKNTSLVETALAIGYSDQAHMTRQMRRWLGITPAGLRKNASQFRHMVNQPDAFTDDMP